MGEMSPYINILKQIPYVKDATRLHEIVTALGKHGFGQLIIELEKVDWLKSSIQKIGIKVTDTTIEPTSLPTRLRMLFQELGSTFIKFGQILSTRPDLLPEPFIEELKQLQDHNKPFEFDKAKRQIETELGKPLNDVYTDFQEEPLGVASIGQTYKAVLKTGEKVVVKVQKPDIRHTIESDLTILHYACQWIEKRVPQLKAIDPSGIIDEFRIAIMKELDYSNELRNALKFAQIFKDNSDIVIPKVFRDFSTMKILTMEFIPGKKITEATLVGSDPKILSRKALGAVFTMVFENGFFHADPHPGNVFALPDNRIAFIDLGMVGRLEETMRYRLGELIVAMREREIETIARTLLVMGIRTGRVNVMQFRRDVADIMDKITDVPLEDIHFSEIVRDLMEGAQRNHIKIPNEYALMGKAILTVESVAKQLDPTLNIETEVSPYIRRLVVARFSPKRVARSLFKRLVEVYHWSNDLPSHVMTILDDLQSGNLKVKVEQTDQNRLFRNIEKMVLKLTGGLIISSLILSSALFITFSKLDYQIMGIPVALALGGVGYVLAALFGFGLLHSGFSRSDSD
jgi:ubiquinone biosynthesis protein